MSGDQPEAGRLDQSSSDPATSGHSAQDRPRPPQGQRPKKRDIHGWLVLDKPVGMTSTHAVALAKRAFRARKAGHAGTLDPLASGLLPIAFGEATKTVPYVMDGRKAYRFTVRWGIETDTDDSEGKPVATSEARPEIEAIETILPGFMGEVMQVPPAYSALKINGERAYDLARDGETVELQPRPVVIHALRLVEARKDEAEFEAECGKGTYVRALARDFGRRLGCLGHIVGLRRTRVGSFTEGEAHPASLLEDAIAAGEDAPDGLLRPVATALGALTAVPVSGHDAARLRNGQPVLLRGRDAPIEGGMMAVFCHRDLVALASLEQGELHPKRIFNLGDPR
jgi:tRNA pseudouridine55 synthase